MAIFKTQEEKEKELLNKYGLNTLRDPGALKAVKKIAQEMVGSGTMELGLKLKFAKPEYLLPVIYQRTIVEQNFLMIRQLDQIAQILKDGIYEE